MFSFPVCFASPLFYPYFLILLPHQLFIAVFCQRCELCRVQNIYGSYMQWTDENIVLSICVIDYYIDCSNERFIGELRIYSPLVCWFNCKHNYSIIIMLILIIHYFVYLKKIFIYRVVSFPFSALTLLVERRKGIWVLACWWQWFDWSFARPIAPVVTTTSIILCFSKLRLTQENGR